MTFKAEVSPVWIKSIMEVFPESDEPRNEELREGNKEISVEEWNEDTFVPKTKDLYPNPVEMTRDEDFENEAPSVASKESPQCD